MDKLIDLNRLHDTGYLLKRRAASPADIRKAVIGGFSASFFIVLFFIVEFIGRSSEAIFQNRENSFVLIISTVLSIVFVWALIAAWISLKGFTDECRDGFLRINPEEIECWTEKGIVNIPIENLFGVGVENDSAGEYLRLCYMADTKSGLEVVEHDFQNYVVVKGKGHGDVSGHGNFLARVIILDYVEERRKRGHAIAKLPAYALKSTYKYNVYDDRNHDLSFACDGKILTYNYHGNIRTVPVSLIKNVSIIRGLEEGMKSEIPIPDRNDKILPPEKFAEIKEINLVFDPASGLDPLVIKPMHMTNSEEVGKYCKCLSTLLEKDEVSKPGDTVH